MIFRPRPIAAGFCLLVLAGCSTENILEPKSIDYRSAGKVKPLEVPPDLTQPKYNDHFVVSDTAGQSGATYSEYAGDRSAATPGTQESILSMPDKVSIQRSGSERWLSVDESPDKVWNTVKEFWLDNGFIIVKENRAAGIMETDWAENRAKIPQDAIRSIIGKVFDDAYSTPERDKFRTRLELAGKNNTEVFISHRGMYEVVKGGDGGTEVIWEPRPADPNLEAEMLARLAQRFGVDEKRARAMATQVQAAPKAKFIDNGTALQLDNSFDRGWRRLGLALDRIGFTVEDRDRSKGIYYVRYLDPDTEGSEKGGFLSWMAFWKSESKPAPSAQYQIHLEGSGDTSTVTVDDAKGQKDSSKTAQSILKLLLEQLK